MQHFKKDSRVWLHKNSERKLLRDSRDETLAHIQQRDGNDEDMEMDQLIRGNDGKMYKKDSRTWLHKSSARQVAREVTLDSLRTVVECQFQLQPRDSLTQMNIKEKSTFGNLMAKDSWGLIRSQFGAGKRKKSAQKGGNCLSSTSHRDIHLQTTNDNDNIYYQYHDKKTRIQSDKGSYSDNDPTNDGSSTDDDDNADIYHEDIKNNRSLGRFWERPLAKIPRTPSRSYSCEGLNNGRSPTAFEISNTGLKMLRDFAREIQPRSESRPYYVTDPVEQAEDPYIQHLDTSSIGQCSSKSSLNLCAADLSDECLSDHSCAADTQSDYQLSHATKCLRVQPPTHIQHQYFPEQE